jgi:hypothetical protein
MTVIERKETTIRKMWKEMQVKETKILNSYTVLLATTFDKGSFTLLMVLTNLRAATRVLGSDLKTRSGYPYPL